MIPENLCWQLQNRRGFQLHQAFEFHSKTIVAFKQRIAALFFHEWLQSDWFAAKYLNIPNNSICPCAFLFSSGRCTSFCIEIEGKFWYCFQRILHLCSNSVLRANWEAFKYMNGVYLHLYLPCWNFHNLGLHCDDVSFFLWHWHDDDCLFEKFVVVVVGSCGGASIWSGVIVPYRFYLQDVFNRQERSEK